MAHLFSITKVRSTSQRRRSIGEDSYKNSPTWHSNDMSTPGRRRSTAAAQRRLGWSKMPDFSTKHRRRTTQIHADGTRRSGSRRSSSAADDEGVTGEATKRRTNGERQDSEEPIILGTSSSVEQRLKRQALAEEYQGDRQSRRRRKPVPAYTHAIASQKEGQPLDRKLQCDDDKILVGLLHILTRRSITVMLTVIIAFPHCTDFRRVAQPSAGAGTRAPPHRRRDAARNGVRHQWTAAK